MITAKIYYEKGLKTLAQHTKSLARIETDAPLDNQGKGQAFSPTDLLATSLGSCMLTLIGIVSERNNINISGLYSEVEKEMAKNPRRISRINIKIIFNKYLSASDRKKIELAASSCPVAKSLSSNLKINIKFIYE
tara:strand:- start:1695 stop:2099 length:405 start_codon:yes stop_codon:yes gene_type:complete